MMTSLQMGNVRQLVSLFCYMNSPFYLQDERSIAAKLYRHEKGVNINFDIVHNWIIDAVRKGIVSFYNTYGEGVTDPTLFDYLKNQYTKLDQAFPPSTLRQLLRHCLGMIVVQCPEGEKEETEYIGITDIKTRQCIDADLSFTLKDVLDIKPSQERSSSIARS